MKGFPTELIYVLLFVGMFLLQYMLKRRRRHEPQESSQDGGVAQSRAEMSEFADLGQDDAIAWGGSRAAADRLAQPEAPPALRARPRLRFSRQSLMGNRRDVQNAFVIAAILGPCRALEPPGGAPDPASPRQTAR